MSPSDKLPKNAFDSFLAHGSQLIGHGLVRPAVYRHDALAWRYSANMGRQRYNLNPVQVRYSRLIGYDDRRPPLANFSANRRPESHPPDLTSLHP